jgi:hypothetical protein
MYLYTVMLNVLKANKKYFLNSSKALTQGIICFYLICIPDIK